MAPKVEEGEIPTGWNLETEVKKDGSTVSFYHCPGTGQHFFAYSDLIRYVEYAKRRRFGIYSLCHKAIKRQRKLEEERIAKSKRAISVLSLPKKPSDSNSLAVNQFVEKESLISSESTDNEEDEEHAPESDGDDLADSEPDTIDEEKQITKEDTNDLKSP